MLILFYVYISRPGNGFFATFTGNSRAHSEKIPTANLRYSTMANAQEAYLGVSKDDRQLKMVVKTGNSSKHVSHFNTSVTK